MTARRLPLGSWLPDVPMLEAPGLRDALNSTKRPLGYGPQPSLEAVSGGYGSLDDFALGSFHTVDGAGSAHNFAGTKAKLWHIQTGAWADVSKGGGYATPDTGRWESCLFQSVSTGRNPMVFFTNYVDPVQYFAIGSSTAFADITASLANPGTADGAPRARHCAVIGAQLHLGYTFDTVDGLVTNRGWWSAINNAITTTPNSHS